MDSMFREYTKSFWVAGIPRPMPRVKATSRGKFVRIYTPPGPWEAWKANVYHSSGKPPAPAHDGPVEIELEYQMPFPQSFPKSKRIPGTYCKRLPDIDNLEKLILDSLKSRGWFTDDGRVCAVKHRKVYSETPGVHVTIVLLPDYTIPKEFIGHD